MMTMLNDKSDSSVRLSALLQEYVFHGDCLHAYYPSIGIGK